MRCLSEFRLYLLLSLWLGAVHLGNNTQAQNYTKNWPMSPYTTLTFVGNQVNLSTNSFNYLYASTCANDINGNLLFNSEGTNVYTAGGAIMPEGDGLYSSNNHKGTLALPFVSNPQRYFLFQVSHELVPATPGFSYTIVDLSLNSGLGDVLLPYKNITLNDSNRTSISVVSTAHRDGERAWVLTHDAFPIDSFVLLLVGDTIEKIMHQATADTVGSNLLALSSMYKFSSNSKYFARVCADSSLEVYSFNNETGALAFHYSIAFPHPIRTLEFSSQSNLLYTSGEFSTGVHLLYQIDLQNNYTVQLIDTFQFIYDLQLDNTGRILITPNDYFSLGAIMEPNLPGLSCAPNDSLVYFNSLNINSRFPNFISNWFNRSFCVQQRCQGDSTLFYYAGYRIDSAIWDFGDPASGSLNGAEGLEVKHSYADTGTYQITLYVTTGLETDTIQQDVRIEPVLQKNALTKDSLQICLGDTVLLDATQPTSCQYLWHDSTTTPLFQAIDSGWYRVTATNGCEQVADSIYIGLDEPLHVVLSPDTAICVLDTISFGPFPELDHFVWFDGDNSSDEKSFSLEDNQSISVWLSAENACGVSSDTSHLTSISLPNATWFHDSILCSQTVSDIIPPSTANGTYTLLFQNGSALDTVADWNIGAEGNYIVVAENVCGRDESDALLSPNQIITAELPSTYLVCRGDSLRLDVSSTDATYQWSDNVDPNHQTERWLNLTNIQTNAEYVVTVSSGLCSKTLLTNIELKEEVHCIPRCAFEVPNVFSPNGDGINDRLSITNACGIQEIQYDLYNRWGQLVYSNKGRGQQWDGYINGTLASEGVYYLMLDYTDNSGASKSARLSFQLLH